MSDKGIMTANMPNTSNEMMNSDPVSYASRLALHVHSIASLPQREIVKRLGGLFRLLVDPDSIPDDNRRNLNATATASISLEAVGESSVHFNPYANARELVISHADHLIPWARHFYRTKIRNRLDPIHSNEEEKQKLIRNLSSVFYTITLGLIGKGTNPHLQVYPYYDIISGLWLEENAHYPESEPWALASKTLWMIFNAAEQAPLIEATVHSADGDADRVARVALEKLRHAMKAPAPNRALIIRHYHNAFMFLLHPDNVFTDVLRKSCEQLDPVITFAKGMRLLSDRASAGAFNKERNGDFGMLCELCFPNFNYGNIIHTGNGTRTLRQSIRYGVLDGIVELLLHYGSTSKKHTDISVLSEAFALLHISLGIRSVCIDIQQTFKRLTPSTEMPRSPGRKEWQRFTDAVMVQSIFLHLATRHTAKIREPSVDCSHCKKRFTKSCLKRCGRCRIAVYCSEECQAEDWKNGHKNTCNFVERTTQLRIFEPRTDLEDRAFFTLIARYDFQRHWIHLRDLTRIKYPNVHPNLVGFTVNFTRGSPPSYRSFLVHELADDDDATCNAKSKVIGMAETDGSTTGRHTIMLIVTYCVILGISSKKSIITETAEEETTIALSRTRPEILRTRCRPSGRFEDGDTSLPLEARPDAFDVVLREMAVEADENPSLLRDPKKFVESLMLDIEIAAKLKEVLSSSEDAMGG